MGGAQDCWTALSAATAGCGGGKWFRGELEGLPISMGPCSKHLLTLLLPPFLLTFLTPPLHFSWISPCQSASTPTLCSLPLHHLSIPFLHLLTCPLFSPLPHFITHFRSLRDPALLPPSCLCSLCLFICSPLFLFPVQFSAVWLCNLQEVFVWLFVIFSLKLLSVTLKSIISWLVYHIYKKNTARVYCMFIYWRIKGYDQ